MVKIFLHKLLNFYFELRTIIHSEQILSELTSELPIEKKKDYKFLKT